MMNPRMLVITPDQNSPKHGEYRRTIIRSSSIIEDIEDGTIATGDPVFAFYDPEGDMRDEYETGWGCLGTIVSLRVEDSENLGSKIAVIEYDDEAK